MPWLNFLWLPSWFPRSREPMSCFNPASNEWNWVEFDQRGSVEVHKQECRQAVFAQPVAHLVVGVIHCGKASFAFG